ncbi:hypothetical protein C8Q75DRAFT_809151 [Abortiporus biennis]|nr:hypothetical protein C8Q75DRAFT_809151 [Abortiporus biennis]
MSSSDHPDNQNNLPPQDIVEYTKDGAVSRMRSHKGNIPSLPQNKLCPLCPAKFTRTTHLNRHLRTHSNERMHECERCHAQFTRSDLLARHKRNCGESSSVHRSRRKSCQACAESKVKCDQQQPCSKCRTRGRECIYRVTSSSGYPASQPGSSFPKQEESFSSQRINSHGSSASPENDEIFASRFSSAHISKSSSQLENSDVTSATTSSYASSSAASQTTEYNDSNSTPSFAREALEVQNHLNALFSNEMFDKFFNYFETNTGSVVGVPGTQAGSISMDTYSTDPEFPFPTPSGELQPFMAAIDPLDIDAYNAYVGASSAPSLYDTTSIISNIPQPGELQYYLHLFFTRFLEQMPIIHPATFNVEKKPAMFVSAMQACGALYAKTPAAQNFIASTLTSARDVVVSAFASHPTRSEDQTHLVLAVCLLQTIGLFHERPEQRAQSNIYHGMLVMMIRQSGLLGYLADYKPPAFDENTIVDTAWRDWVCYETTKRAVSLTFLHDCCHSLYFTLRPTFGPREFNLYQPSEDALWKASSSQEWQMVLMQPSPYGSISERLRGGPTLQSTLDRLAVVLPDSQPAILLNPFSQFIVIHAILRKLFEDCMDKVASASSSSTSLGSPSSNPQRKQSSSSSPLSSSLSQSQSHSQTSSTSRQKEYDTRINPTIQFMLHNWLQSWFQSPETPRPSKLHQPPFMYDALPFYWIAQVSLLAYQEGLPPFASDVEAFNASGEAKFILMKEWFKHIRAFLKNGEQGPTLFWDELMKIRLQNWHLEKDGVGGGGSSNTVDGDGLLGFFPGH